MIAPPIWPTAGAAAAAPAATAGGMSISYRHGVELHRQRMTTETTTQRIHPGVTILRTTEHEPLTANSRNSVRLSNERAAYPGISTVLWIDPKLLEVSHMHRRYACNNLPPVVLYNDDGDILWLDVWQQCRQGPAVFFAPLLGLQGPRPHATFVTRNMLFALQVVTAVVSDRKNSVAVPAFAPVMRIPPPI